MRARCVFPDCRSVANFVAAKLECDALSLVLFVECECRRCWFFCCCFARARKSFCTAFGVENSSTFGRLVEVITAIDCFFSAVPLLVALVPSALMI